VFKSVVDRGKNNKRKTERRRKIVKTERNSRAGNARTEEITISTHSSFWNDPNKTGKL
jgi:hypothetical protein